MIPTGTGKCTQTGRTPCDRFHRSQNKRWGEAAWDIADNAGNLAASSGDATDCKTCHERQTNICMFVSLQLRPLSELVKEVQCAGVKKIYLRRAIEQYLSESAPCHCRPCSNNGLVFTDGDNCKCVCKPGTSGLACEQGAEIEGQPGESESFAAPVSCLQANIGDVLFILPVSSCSSSRRRDSR